MSLTAAFPNARYPAPSSTPHGIQGDSWAHPQIHGGPRKALLIVCAEAIDELRAEGYPVFPGALGENLTVRDSTGSSFDPASVFAPVRSGSN